MDSKARRLILIFEKELNELMLRLDTRQEQAVSIFSRERRRSHFDNLFRNRFETAPLSELVEIPEVLLNTLIDFFSEVDELKWYLHHTEDMPLTVEQTIQSHQRRLDNLHHAFQKQLNHLASSVPSPQPFSAEEFCSNYLDSLDLLEESNLDWSLAPSTAA